MQAKKLASGTILRGEYVLLGIIGDGGSNVFRAHHRRDNRLVAVRIQQLDNAAAAAHSLELPNTAQRVRDPLFSMVEASGQTKEGFFFVVSEYVSGQRMDQWADKVGIPPLGAVTELVQRVARALNTLHGEGVAHGAVNPRNLVLLRTDSGKGQGLKAKLLDHGVPAFMRPRPPRLRSSYFMAPEQLALLLRGDGGAAQESDSRMDVYGCGCLLYYLATGGPPYQGRSLGELIAAHTSGQLLPPSRINPRIPGALEGVILRALANDPAERYADGGELAAALAEMRRTSSVSGVILRPSAPVPPREAGRESPVDLGEIFSDFEFEERPTSQIPIIDVSPLADADTVPPPADMGEFDDRPLPPPVSTPPVSMRPESIAVAAASSTPPPIPAAAAVSSPPPVPAAAAPASSVPPRVSPLPAAMPPLPNAASTTGRTSVPAGSFSSVPPPPSVATDRLSMPFRPASRSQRAPVEQPALQSPFVAQQQASAIDTDAAVAEMQRNPWLARIESIDRRWLALPFACVTFLIAYFILSEPSGDDGVTVSALAVEAPSAAPVARARPTTPAVVSAAPRARESTIAVPTRQPTRPEPRYEAAAPRASNHPARTRTSTITNSRAPSAPPAPAVLKLMENASSSEPELSAEREPVRVETVAPPEPGPLARAVEAREAPEPKPAAAKPGAEPNAQRTITPAAKSEPKPPAKPLSFAANADVRELSVRGSLANSDVRHTIERVRAQFAQCYETAARSAGRNAFGDEVGVDMTLDENGRAGKPSASGGGLAGLNACVAQVAGKMVSSRRPDTGTVKATFKLAFVPKTP